MPLTECQRASGFLSNPTLVVSAIAFAATATALFYALHQQKGSPFGNRGYNKFERKYAAKLKASRQKVAAATTGSSVGATPGAAEELEMSSLATVKIIYGSDSGTAEAFAKGLAVTLNDRGVSAALIDPGRWAYLERYTSQKVHPLTLFQFPERLGAVRGAAARTVAPTSPDLTGELPSVHSTPASANGGTPRENGLRSPLKAKAGLPADDRREEGGAQPEVLLFVVATAGEGEPTANFQTLLQEMQHAVQHSQQLANSAGSAGSVPLPTKAHSRPPNRAAKGLQTSNSLHTSPVESPVLNGPVFAHVKYSVFALGDSSYKYYCRAGMTVNTLMKTGGGVELQRLGFGDARGGVGKQEESFEEWQDGVMEALEEVCGIRLTAGSLNPPKPQMTYVTFSPSAASSPSPAPLQLLEGLGESVVGPAVAGATGTTPLVRGAGTKALSQGGVFNAAQWSAANAVGVDRCGPAPFPPPPPLLEPSQHRPSLIQLVRKEQLTPEREGGGGAVYRFTFSLDGTNISYQAGDHLGIFPTNSPAVVDRCAALLGLTEADLAMEVELQEARTRTVLCNTLPARVTLRTALSCYADLSGKPKRSALRILAKYCTDAAEKKAFLKLIEAQRASTSRANSSVFTRSPLPAGAATAENAPPPSPSKCVGQESDAASAAPRTVLDYMERYPSCCDGAVPVGHFLEVMPRVQPRYYSIATDRTTHPRAIQIYVRVLPDGLASDFLGNRVAVHEAEGGLLAVEANESSEFVDSTAMSESPSFAEFSSETRRRFTSPAPQQQQQQQSHDTRWHDPSLVFAYVRVSTFHLPSSLSPTAPVLLIGPGTGAAAMIGLLYRREALMRRHPTTPFGDCLFFFGARHESTEFFIKEEVTRWSMAPAEMEAYDKANPDAGPVAATRRAKDTRRLVSQVITLLECAFSRDGPEHVYVTDLINKHADFVYDMIMNNKESMIFLSGDATDMAKAVDRTLVAMIQARGKKGRLSALNVLQNMEGEHRYLKDVY